MINAVQLAQLVKEVLSLETPFNVLNDALQDLGVSQLEPITVYYLDVDEDDVEFIFDTYEEYNDIEKCINETFPMVLRKTFYTKLEAEVFISKSGDYSSYSIKELVQKIIKEKEEYYDNDS